nr:glycosyltransferase [Mycobacterium sp. E796]
MNPDQPDDAPATPLVSVCVPMYNNAATIERCLRSILDQDGVDFEIIVVDDDSSDDGAAVATAMLRPGDRLVKNQPRLGLSGNHNKCLELARGTCVQFVHGDDWLLPGALATLAPYFEDPGVGLAFAPRQVVGNDERWQRMYGKMYTHFRNLGERNDGRELVRQAALGGLRDNWVGEPTCVMFRRRLALDVGGLRDDIYQLVDLDFWLRLMLRSTVCFVPRELSVRSHMKGTETTHVMSSRRYVLDQLRILSWLAVDPASTRSIRITARLWWFPAWLALVVEIAVFGPQRARHLKTLWQATFREFPRARALAVNLGGQAEFVERP